MKLLLGREEVAEALNFGKYPVLKIDLADSDCYGLKGSVCRIDQGVFSDGSKFYEKAVLRVYRDEKKISFSSYGCMLSSTYTFSDFIDEVDLAMAPIIKPLSEIAIAVYDSRERNAYGVFIVKTGKVHRYSTSPIDVEPVDMSAYLALENNLGE